MARFPLALNNVLLHPDIQVSLIYPSVKYLDCILPWILSMNNALKIMMMVPRRKEEKNGWSAQSDKLVEA